MATAMVQTLTKPLTLTEFLQMPETKPALVGWRCNIKPIDKEVRSVSLSMGFGISGYGYNSLNALHHLIHSQENVGK
jgi:hypothetical protein